MALTYKNGLIGISTSKYKLVLEVWNQTGSGLTRLEAAAGMTLDKKLEDLCPHFYRLHVSLGEQANISLAT